MAIAARDELMKRGPERIATLSNRNEKRDGGAVLIVSAEHPDGEFAMPRGGHSDFCNRIHSAKARLFPVKPAAGQGVDFDRMR